MTNDVERLPIPNNLSRAVRSDRSRSRNAVYSMTSLRLQTALACALGMLLATGLCAAPAHAASPALVEAIKLERTGHYAEAIEAYGKLDKAEAVDAALGPIRCWRATGKREETAKHLEAALAAHPKSADVASLAAEIAYERGDFDTARKHVAAALAIDPLHVPSRWVAIELDRDTGKLKEAEAGCLALVRYYNQSKKITSPDVLRCIGLAAAEYARWKNSHEQFTFLVNDLTREMLSRDADFWPAHYEAGRLFAEKYNLPEAKREFQAALGINPQAAEVYAALAALSVQGFEWEQAARMLDRGLAIHPALPALYHARADMHVANFKVPLALEVLEAARPFNPHSEETLGRIAACYLALDGIPDDLASSRFGKLVAEVEARNPACGVFYYTLATLLDSRRKFSDAIQFYQAALEKMPQLVGPQASLGMLYLRMGNEKIGQEILRESFRRDPFNVRVSNSLKVLEVLETYDTYESAHFRFRYGGHRDGLLAKYAAAYLEAEYPKLTKQFGFEVPQKSLIEIFSKAKNTSGHGWFSARLIGLPYLGTVGACAGKMVAMASPNERPYNWARVVKHEFIHVINLQQTGFNMPHWFAEGVATMNEGYPRAAEWDALLRERVPKGELFTLDNVNLGFIRPQSGLEWQLAYCQSELYLEYMVQTHGEESIAKMLAAFAAGLDTTSAIEQALDTTQAEFEAGYRQYLQDLVATLKPAAARDLLTKDELETALEEKPDDPDLVAQLAYQKFQQKAYPEAGQKARQVLEKTPGHPLATVVEARLAMLIGDTKKAQALLEAVHDKAAPHGRVTALLAEIYLQQKQLDEAAELYRQMKARDPHDPVWTQALARIYFLQGDQAKLAPILAEMALADADNFVVRKKLAEMAVQAADHPATIRWGHEALHVNVLDSEVHGWLGKAYAATDQLPLAIAEFAVALELNPDREEYLLGLAAAYVAAEDFDHARPLVEKILARDPGHAAARQLKAKLTP